MGTTWGTQHTSPSATSRSRQEYFKPPSTLQMSFDRLFLSPRTAIATSAIATSAIILALVISVLASDLDSTSSQPQHGRVPVFEPSDEWKEVLPGQAIPRGLHVRMDLSTGKKMARKMQPGDDDKNDPVPTAVVFDKVRHQSPAEFLENTVNTKAFSRIPHIHSLLEDIVVGVMGSQDQLSRSDAVELAAVEARGAESGNTCSRTLNGLNFLLDFVDDIDNAQDFAKAGGLPALYLAANPRTACGVEVKSAAWVVLGSMLQNNRDIQSRALQDGFLTLALPVIAVSDTISEDEVAVMNKAWYGVAAFLRNNNDGQGVFTAMGGWPTTVLAIEKLRDHSNGSIGGAANGALRKIASIIFDIAAERGLEVLRAEVNSQSPVAGAYLTEGETTTAALCQSLASIVQESQDMSLFEQTSDCLASLSPICAGEKLCQVHAALKSRFPQLATAQSATSDEGEVGKWVPGLESARSLLRVIAPCSSQ